MTFTIYYSRNPRDTFEGPTWLRENKPSLIARALELSNTHFCRVDMGRTEAEDLEEVFRQYQPEEGYSPNLRHRFALDAGRVRHTTMSVGDLIVDENDEVYMVDRFGFENLGRVTRTMADVIENLRRMIAAADKA